MKVIEFRSRDAGGDVQDLKAFLEEFVEMVESFTSPSVRFTSGRIDTRRLQAAQTVTMFVGANGDWTFSFSSA